jgi:hypothetical protein
MTANALTGATDPRGLGKIAAAGLVPASALAAGLGGVALGAVPGAIGVPGFQQNVALDPEGYVNQNPRGIGTTTRQYGIS